MKNYLGRALCTIAVALFVASASPAAAAMGYGYCTPFRVLCNDGIMFIGKSVPRGAITSSCYFEDPPGFKDISRKNWAYQVCMKGHRGVKETYEPKLFSSTDLPALIGAEKQINPALYDAVMAKLRQTRGPEEAQSVFDFYIQRKLGNYYEPISLPNKFFAEGRGVYYCARS